MRSNSPAEADAPAPGRSIATTAIRNNRSRLTGSTQYTAPFPPLLILASFPGRCKLVRRMRWGQALDSVFPELLF